MARRDADNGKHGIRIPGVILDQIREGEDGEEDARFQNSSHGKKRKQPTLSRKEKRKQERETKKQKRSQNVKTKVVANNKKSVKSGPTTGRDQDPLSQLSALKTKKSENKSGKKVEKEKKNVRFLDDSEAEEDPLAKLAKLKGKKLDKSGDVRVVKESEIESDNDAEQDYDVSDEDFSDDFEEEEGETEDPLAALARLKGKKANSVIRLVKEDDISDDVSDDISDDISENFSDVDSDSEVDNEEGSDDDNTDPLALLAALKKGKAKSSDVRVVKEDDLEDDSFDDDIDVEDEEIEGDSEDEDEAFDGFESEDDNEEEFLDEEEIDEDPLAKLKKLKAEKKKGKKMQEDTHFEVTPDVREKMKRDEDDMEYYAKKLGLKKGKKDKLKKIDDDDILGGLLDGLDFDYLEDDNEISNPESVDDEFGSDAEVSDEDYTSKKVKENPYVAPTQDNAEDDEPASESGSTRYIPPALRRKMALEGQGDSEEIIQLKRAIKGPLNKLSEANLANVVNDINALYLSNPRQTVNEILTTTILDGIILQTRLLDMFVFLQAALAASITKLQGVDFGAYFIQTIVEKYDTFRENGSKAKETLNVVSLLSSVFIFLVISSRLLYDIIKELIEALDERNAELLLKILKIAGNQMRSDDPTALKEIILLINKKQAEIPKDQVSTRTSFLIETITNLKNNKLKADENTAKLTSRIKKTISAAGSGHDTDPIQVNLDDIRNVDKRGKWWLVGSAWKGHEGDKMDADINEEAINDALDSAEPNWMELARSQRMNTDIRRAIFISIMSANDFVDAMTKLDKLGLKRAQEREIPRVLVHCTGIEPAWNPYYGILAFKLCDSHSYRKTFQFMLWDVIKEFDNSQGGDSDEEDFLGFDYADDDEEVKLRRILNLGRFFGFLFARGALSLHVLRTVNYLTLTGDALLFQEVMFVSFLDTIAKMSQINAIGSGIGRSSKSEHRYEDKLLIERILKAQEQPALLRGLQHFLESKVLHSEVISGKKQKKRIEWGVRALTDIVDELLRHAKDRF